VPVAITNLTTTHQNTLTPMAGVKLTSLQPLAASILKPLIKNGYSPQARTEMKQQKNGDMQRNPAMDTNNGDMLVPSECYSNYAQETPSSPAPRS
jgi:hypothetical protein